MLIALCGVILYNLDHYREEEYAVHIKCFTEDERYGAKGSLPNGIIKKGEKKQESWMEMIHSIINEEKNIKLPHRNLLNSLSGYNNVPRKKAKFIVRWFMHKYIRYLYYFCYLCFRILLKIAQEVEQISKT